MMRVVSGFADFVSPGSRCIRCAGAAWLVATILAFPPGVRAALTNPGFETGMAGQVPPLPWTMQTYLNQGIASYPPQKFADLGLVAGGVANTVIVSSATGPAAQPDAALGASASLRWPLLGNQAAAINGPNAAGTNTTGANKNVNVLSQTETINAADVDPTDGLIHIRFSVAPVIQLAGHPVPQEAYTFVEVDNLTRGIQLFHAFYNGNDDSFDPWQATTPINGYHYNYLGWQAIDISSATASVQQGDMVRIMLVAAGCSLGAHAGEMYVDSSLQAQAPSGGLFVAANAPAKIIAPGSLTYTFSYGNHSANTSSNNVVDVAMPPQTTFQSIAAPGATCTTPAVGASGTISCTVGTLPSRASGAFQATVAVAAGTASPIHLANYDIYSTSQPPTLGPSLTTAVLTSTTTTLSSNANPALPGQPVTLTANISANAATGTVAFCDGGSAGDVSFCASGTLLCGTAPVSTAQARCTATALSAGTHSITARYSGDATYASSTSAALVQSILQSQSIAFTSVAPIDAIVGNSYAATATATSGLAVTFSIDAASTPGACAIASGNTVSFAAAGSCLVDADQGGDATYAAAPRMQQRIVAPCYVNQASAGTAADGNTWATAYKDLQSALSSPACAESWVAKGRYVPGSSATSTFAILPGMALYGGFAGTETQRDVRVPGKNFSVLSGDVDGNDAVDANGIDPSYTAIVGTNANHVVTMDGTTAAGIIDGATILDGFTITGGNASSPVGAGGGLYCNGSGAGHRCSPTLRNLHFAGNQAASTGGAMYDNGSGGGNSSPSISDSTFSGNNSLVQGGALYNDGSGSGSNSSPVLVNATFTRNSAGLSGNMGGAIYDNGTNGGNSSPLLSFVTFSGNTASGCGAALFSDGTTGSSAPTITHSILWSDVSGTSGGNEICNSAASVQLVNSIAQGGCSNSTTCTGLIDADPKLGALQDNGGATPTIVADSSGAAFDAASDCNDAGGNPVAYDQRGVARPFSRACDLGAVEFYDRIFADGFEP